MLTVGDVLNDRYRLDESLAGGGMGQVWRATDTLLGRAVAVKLLHTDKARDPGFAGRFRNEARAMAALRHRNVAPVYDYDEGGDGRAAYLVTAYVAGDPLDERIAAAGRIGPAETMSVVAQAARALDAVHQAGIVHRDVKPANLIVEPDGTVVLIDFGIARSPDSPSVTGAHEAVGTARYMAPEQASKRPIGPATDVYSLGVVAYHCLAGRPPFLGDNAATVALAHVREDPPPLPADVPPPVREVVLTAMAKDPRDRYPSAAAVAEAAAALSGPDAAPAAGGEHGGGGSAVAPPGPPIAAPRTRAAPPNRRRRRAAVWAAALITLVAAGLVLALANPLGIGPGTDPPPATPGPVESDEGPGGGGGPGGSGGPGGGGGPTGGTDGPGGVPGATGGPGGGQTGGGTGPGGGTTGGPTGGPTGQPTTEPTGEPTGGTTDSPADEPTPTGGGAPTTTTP